MQTNNPPILNSISVDVEEYFHATNLEQVAPASSWHSLQSRVEHGIDTVLSTFEQCNVKATFFILGYVARRHSSMVRMIHDSGHEIASHGYSHRLAYTQTQRAFARDIQRTKHLLEDITGEAVYGYRAPNFSINESIPWAYETLATSGYRYDSSTYATWHPRYGNPNASRTMYIIEQGASSLVEVPLAVARRSFFGLPIPLPVAGGAYWRLLPHSYSLSGLHHLWHKEQLPAHCYVHPWEFDPEQPQFSNLSALTKWRHYGGLSQFNSRVQTILSQSSFTTIARTIEQQFGNPIATLF